MIPIGTDRRLEHTPLVNYALIAANVLVFVFVQGMRSDSPALRTFLLHPDMPEVHQFFTSMFMHAGWWHLIGNMLFLWVFGNAVNDRLGHVGYLAFYLAGGVIAGVGYVLLSGAAPVLGASGAISAVTGAFLVLFPRVRVTVLVPLFFILMPFEVSSLFFLLLQFGWNMYASFGQGGGVAYAAHSSGYVFGIGVAAGLLAIKALPRDAYDLLNLFRTWWRRRDYQRVVSSGYDPFGPRGSLRRGGRSRRPVKVRTAASEPSDGPEATQLRLRKSIASDHGRGNLAAAADGYVKLIEADNGAVLPLNQQLDVANHLMSVQQYPAAADAYEGFLGQYPNYEHIGDIRLMLGLIYSRYLRQKEQAEAYLSSAAAELTDAGKVELAERELADVRRRLG